MKPFIPQELPLKDFNWESLIPYIGHANRSLARYDGVMEGLPNPDILLSPMITQEAVLSSRIEGTQATLGEVLKFEAGEKPEQEIRLQDINEIINYRKAMNLAEKNLTTRPFNLNLLLELHATLLDSVRGREKDPGKFRKTQNYIGKPGSKLDEMDFIPPAPMDLMKYLDNWEKYYHMDRPDPLVQLAVVHAQFEIIHPFSDGNGRLGRMLVPLFLYEKKLLSRPTFYLSEYLEERRGEYISRLRDIGRADDAWNRWIEFFLKAMDEQARRNSRKAVAIMNLYEKMKARFIDLIHSRHAVPLLDIIFQRPIFHATHLKFDEDVKPGRVSLAKWIKILVKSGILEVLREGKGRRPQLLVLPELINLCEGKKVI
ncbi:MAG: Fic family protein [Nitrospinota bacterium]|nr:Fic family protein [Nitrospinota bacterium]